MRTLAFVVGMLGFMLALPGLCVMELGERLDRWARKRAADAAGGTGER